MIRSLIAAFTLFSINILLTNNVERNVERFLYGALFFITLNSVVVVITAITPDIYSLLNIQVITGSSKRAVFLRSPGLLQGYDAAGFTSVVGLAALFFLSKARKLPALPTLLAYVLLLLSTALSSRSSLTLFAILSLTFTVMFKYPQLKGRKSKTLQISMILFGILAGYVAATLLSGVWDIDLPTRMSFGLIRPEDIVLYYNIGDLSDYSSHFELGTLSLFPHREVDFLPDNSFFRIGASGGWWAIFFVFLSFIALWRIILKRHVRRRHAFLTIVTVIIFLASSKTNYLYYLPFFLTFSVAWTAARYKGSGTPIVKR